MKNVITESQIYDILTTILYYAKDGKDPQVAKDIITDMNKSGFRVDVASELVMRQCADCLEFFPPFMMSLEAKNRSGRANICKSCKHFRNLRYKIGKMKPIDGLIESVKCFMSSVMWDLPQTSKKKQFGKLISNCLRVVKSGETDADYGKSDDSVFWNRRSRPSRVGKPTRKAHGKKRTRTIKKDSE